MGKRAAPAVLSNSPQQPAWAGAQTAETDSGAADATITPIEVIIICLRDDLLRIWQLCRRRTVVFPKKKKDGRVLMTEDGRPLMKEAEVLAPDWNRCGSGKDPYDYALRTYDQLKQQAANLSNHPACQRAVDRVIVSLFNAPTHPFLAKDLEQLSGQIQVLENTIRWVGPFQACHLQTVCGLEEQQTRRRLKKLATEGKARQERSHGPWMITAEAFAHLEEERESKLARDKARAAKLRDDFRGTTTRH